MRLVIESLIESHPNITNQTFLYLLLSYWLHPTQEGRFTVITENCCMLKWEQDDVLILYGKIPRVLHLTGALVNDIVCQLNTSPEYAVEDILSSNSGTIDYILDQLPWPKIKDQASLV